MINTTINGDNSLIVSSNGESANYVIMKNADYPEGMYVWAKPCTVTVQVENSYTSSPSSWKIYRSTTYEPSVAASITTPPATHPDNEYVLQVSSSVSQGTYNIGRFNGYFGDVVWGSSTSVASGDYTYSASINTTTILNDTIITFVVSRTYNPPSCNTKCTTSSDIATCNVRCTTSSSSSGCGGVSNTSLVCLE